MSFTIQATNIDKEDRGATPCRRTVVVPLARLPCRGTTIRGQPECQPRFRAAALRPVPQDGAENIVCLGRSDRIPRKGFRGHPFMYPKSLSRRHDRLDLPACQCIRPSVPLLNPIYPPRELPPLLSLRLFLRDGEIKAPCAKRGASRWNLGARVGQDVPGAHPHPDLIREMVCGRPEQIGLLRDRGRQKPPQMPFTAENGSWRANGSLATTLTRQLALNSEVSNSPTINFSTWPKLRVCQTWTRMLHAGYRNIGTPFGSLSKSVDLVLKQHH